MSADNRVIVHQAPNDKWFVWEGSLSFNYFEPPADSVSFNEEDDAWEYARKLESEMCVCEGGAQRLSQIEIIDGLRQELDMLKNPGYCPEFNSCGEEGCCSGAKCVKNAANKCLYGENYAADYRYNKAVADKLFNALNVYDSVLAGQIVGETFNSIYESKTKTP